MDAIAAQAGVSRPALYRRYASVGQTALAALQARGPVVLPIPYSTNIEKDLCSYFNALVASLADNSAMGRALRGTLAASLVDIDLKPHFAQFITARRKPVLDRLLAWNGSYGDAEHESIADALFGPILYRLLIRHVPVRTRHIQGIVHRALGSPA